MPLEYRIDHERRLVLATGRGTLGDAEIFGYQREVWSRPEVAGYDELVDTSDVEHLEVPSTDRLKALVELAASMDPPVRGSKFAIVAPDSIANDVAQFFKIYRELEPRSTKKVEVFTSPSAALDWLGTEKIGGRSGT